VFFFASLSSLPPSTLFLLVYHVFKPCILTHREIFLVVLGLGRILLGYLSLRKECVQYADSSFAHFLL
jgi:hypothetical protein